MALTAKTRTKVKFKAQESRLSQEPMQTNLCLTTFSRIGMLAVRFHGNNLRLHTKNYSKLERYVVHRYFLLYLVDHRLSLAVDDDT